ncbi:MAG: diguanylate cyclase [Candidatus Omnitrophica bacterium]|nr:diguanylate cyclase [Candidatus Omnitrophota bacterium]
MARAVIADDSPFLLKQLERLLKKNNIEIVGMAANGEEALEQATSELPDVILLDINMPVMDGYETCQHLKQSEKTKNIPIIFLTGSKAEEDIVTGLTIGAQGYITKPYNEKELIARINVAAKIRTSEKEIETLALTDALTGLYNRRFLLQRFKEEIERTGRHASGLSCMMLDIDYFKKINDTYGHDVGDFVLKEIADVLRTNVREYDTVARFGGEEFMVLIPGAAPVHALEIGEKIRKKVEEHELKKDDEKISVTVSIGVFGCMGIPILDDIEQYIKCADEALYVAKIRGRNRIVTIQYESPRYRFVTSQKKQ